MFLRTVYKKKNNVDNKKQYSKVIGQKNVYFDAESKVLTWHGIVEKQKRVILFCFFFAVIINVTVDIIQSFLFVYPGV